MQLAVTADPTSLFNAVAGSTVTFTAAAIGTPTPSVQWQLSTDNGATVTNLAGATSTTLSVQATNIETVDQYRAVFTNSEGVVTTASAQLLATTTTLLQNGTYTATANGGTLSVTGPARRRIRWLTRKRSRSARARRRRSTATSARPA